MCREWMNRLRKITWKMVSLPVLCRYQKIIKKVLAEHDVELEKMFYMDFAKQKETIRVFQNRQKINLVALREGRLAEKENEIVLERRYAEEHQYTVGSQITLGKIKFQVTGIATTPDYDLRFAKCRIRL